MEHQSELTNSTVEQFRVWHGYHPGTYPHCAGAPEASAVADQESSEATLCYSSDDIAESTGIVVSLWNMTSGGSGNRAVVHEQA
mmetsp:Transcript_12869/g.14047  ORF Transcript_12869/g.14047 Transcript_12869/m.14047 type:complete len:84 (-) Transcript_12869:90-341(-)